MKAERKKAIEKQIARAIKISAPLDSLEEGRGAIVISVNEAIDLLKQKEIYISAIKGRKDMRLALKEAKIQNEELRDFAIWMTGCGYDFTQHEYFNKKRDELIKHFKTNQDES